MCEKNVRCRCPVMSLLGMEPKEIIINTKEAISFSVHNSWPHRLNFFSLQELLENQVKHELHFRPPPGTDIMDRVIFLLKLTVIDSLLNAKQCVKCFIQPNLFTIHCNTNNN